VANFDSKISLFLQVYFRLDYAAIIIGVGAFEVGLFRRLPVKG
jgi:hypothetical protein